MMYSTAEKQQALTELLRELDPVVVAYSGGVDSSYLAAVAHDALGADRAVAVTAVSPALARSELDDARGLARRLGWNHMLVETHEGEREEYARNASDRCYWCKTELFDVLDPIARVRSAQIVTGTNADDLGDYRPGLRAARERAVRAPLAEVGLTKDEVRSLSAARGLPSADKPASPCLASRFAYGVRVTRDGLRRVEEAERYLRSLGFRELRVRDHGDLARVEVPAEDIGRAAERHAQIAETFSGLGFKYVTLDLMGFRSGSLNEILSIDKLGRPR
ncbi:MAG: ATP-dependent sacrificial sulfur transferase LarE [Actinomycetota bacterium]|nr:ATP-dependent sacrificial sulfur transferase LarE [Actinomycetota bacterium]